MDVTSLLQRFNDASLHVSIDGPPHYDSSRVIVTGNPAGFQLLAAFLLEMAGAVASPGHPASLRGWHLALDSRDIPQLEMDNSILVLNCEARTVGQE
jgi:hypothetical protein